MNITQQRLRELLDYDSERGTFFWKSRNGSRIPAGDVRGDGYVRIQIDRKRYLAHRLVFLYLYGKFPEFEVDHINGNQSDNREENLRDINHAQNLQNVTNRQRSNTSGFTGVSRNGNGFRASIKLNRRQIGLGTYKTKEEAHDAYLEAKRRFHPFGSHNQH